MKSWEKKHRIDGRISGNAIEPSSYKKRHNTLAKEMLLRGMNHKSPLFQPDFSYLPREQYKYKVDIKSSHRDLIARCDGCKKLIA
jgi:hypothetical protein